MKSLFNKKSYLLLTLILAILAQGCIVLVDGDEDNNNNQRIYGSGVEAIETRSLPNMTGVELSSVGNVFIQAGGTNEVRIEGDDNLIDYIETVVSNGVLLIKSRRGYDLRPDQELKIFVTLSRLDQVSVTGSGRLEAAETVSGNDFDVQITGSGDIYLGAVELDQLDVEITGSGNLDIGSGYATNQDVTLTGSGKYYARNVSSDEVDVDLSGSGELTVRVASLLDGSISGSGTVRYYGSPSVAIRVTGTGHADQVGNK